MRSAYCEGSQMKESLLDFGMIVFQMLQLTKYDRQLVLDTLKILENITITSTQNRFV